MLYKLLPENERPIPSGKVLANGEIDELSTEQIAKLSKRTRSTLLYVPEGPGRPPLGFKHVLRRQGRPRTLELDVHVGGAANDAHILSSAVVLVRPDQRNKDCTRALKRVRRLAKMAIECNGAQRTTWHAAGTMAGVGTALKRDGTLSPYAQEKLLERSNKRGQHFDQMSELAGAIKAFDEFSRT